MMAGFSTRVMAQTGATASNTAAAVLLVPMTLTATSPLNFGSINILTGSTGTCTMSTATINNCTYFGGVVASTFKSTPSCATYNVTGTYDMTYALTIIDDILLTNHLAAIGSGAAASGASLVGTATMHINLLKVLFSNGGSEMPVLSSTSQLSASGTDSFRIGGVLTVGPAQASGNYSGTYTASVDYN